MFSGTEMEVGVVGGWFVCTEPSSETESEESRTKAGRTPIELS